METTRVTARGSVAGPLIARLIWLLGGADPELLSACPFHERVKFAFIASVNTILAAGLALLTEKFLARFLHTVEISGIFSRESSLVSGIAIFTAVFVFLGILRLLVAAVRSFTEVQRWGRAASWVKGFPIWPGKPFIPAFVLAIWGTLMILMAGGSGAPNTISWLTAISWTFQFVVLLTPLAIASAWTSPAYTGRVRKLAESSTARPDPFTGFAPTQPADIGISEEQRDALRGLQESFNRNPRNFDIGRALIELHRSSGSLRETLPIFDALISADPVNTDLIREKASIYQKLGDDARYRKTLEQVDQIQARVSFEENIGKRFVLRGLHMQGLGFFGNFSWELQPGLNILLGKNGYGKSHLLRALLATLQCDEKVSQEFFLDTDSAPQLRVDATRDGQPVSTVRRLLVFDESFGKVPVLAIPDMRYVDKSRDSVGAPSDPAGDFRSQSAYHMLQQLPYEGLVLNFLYELCLDYLDHRRSFDAPIFKLIEDSINTLAQPALAASASRPEFRFREINRRDNAQFDIRVWTEGNESRPLPLQKASQGTLSVVAMIGLVYKYLKAIYKDAADTEVRLQAGIVVIDEIDAHLHPSWQQRIVALFRETFPNVQFIVTAHSPLVVAGAREREVAVLRRTDAGFVVEVSEGNFIGATAAEMYRRVFEIEEKDSTYLRLGTLHMRKERIASEVAFLEQKDWLNPQEEMDYERLAADLGDLKTFEAVRDRREEAERLENRNQDLEVQVLAMKGTIDRLSRLVQGKETASSDGPSSGQAV